MRYLLLTNGLPPPFSGGSGRYLYNILRFMPSDQTIVFTEGSRSPGDPAELDLRYIRRSYIAYYNSTDPIVARHIKKLLMLIFWAVELFFLCIRERPQCVMVGQVRYVGLLGVFLKRLFNVPYVAFVYAEELTTASNRDRSIQFVLQHADRIVTISDFSTKLLLERGVQAERVVLARPGIDVAAYQITDRTRLKSFRANLAADDHKILLTVGRLIKRKGHALVLSILPRVLEIIPKLRYVIVGEDRGEGQILRQLVKKLHLENYVIFEGFVNEYDIPYLYNACDVFIMPNYELANNDTEGFGIVFLEANAAGKPVIGGNAGGTADAVADGVSGLLVDAMDTEALFQAIVRLLGDEVLAEKLGLQGCQRVKTEFDWEHTASIVCECLEDIRS